MDLDKDKAASRPGGQRGYRVGTGTQPSTRVPVGQTGRPACRPTPLAKFWRPSPRSAPNVSNPAPSSWTLKRSSPSLSSSVIQARLAMAYLATF